MVGPPALCTSSLELMLKCLLCAYPGVPVPDADKRGLGAVGEAAVPWRKAEGEAAWPAVGEEARFAIGIGDERWIGVGDDAR